MTVRPALAGSEIQISGASLAFLTGRARVDVLRGVSLSIARGERVALMGPSGAGKSSLLYCIAGLLQPQDGAVLVDGSDIAKFSEPELAAYRLDRVGLVYQSFQLIGALDALHNAALPLILAGVPRAVALQRARDLLIQIGLEDRVGHRPAQLSGGEQQRVAIARALANGPSLILADEPTGNLDPESGAQVLDLLTTTASGSRTLVVATHDEAVASRMDRVIRVVGGRIQ